MSKSLAISILIDIGFTDKEAQIYFAALSCSTKTISEISRTAEIKRSTAYSIVNNLIEKGIFNTIKKGKKTFYEPLEPEVMLKRKEDQCAALKNNLHLFKNANPLTDNETDRMSLPQTLALHVKNNPEIIYIICSIQTEQHKNTVFSLIKNAHAKKLHFIASADTTNFLFYKNLNLSLSSPHKVSFIPPKNPLTSSISLISKHVVSHEVTENHFSNTESKIIAQNIISLIEHSLSAPSTSHSS